MCSLEENQENSHGAITFTAVARQNPRVVNFPNIDNICNLHMLTMLLLSQKKKKRGADIKVACYQLIV